MVENFQVRPFTYEDKTRTVYWQGSGPGVVIMHELTGMTPATLELGQIIADSGFTAVLPLLFGEAGKQSSTAGALLNLARTCISSDFYLLAKRRSSPVTDWLRALCRHVHGLCGGPGVGAIGLCFTGGYALALMVDPSVMAPVASQPSLPFPITASHRSALALSEEELDVVRQRASAGCALLGLRFSEDPLCPADRFERLRAELGEGFVGIEIDSSEGNPFGIPQRAHSVLTADRVPVEGHPTQEALERVLAMLRKRLLVTD